MTLFTIVLLLLVALELVLFELFVLTSGESSINESVLLKSSNVNEQFSSLGVCGATFEVACCC